MLQNITDYVNILRALASPERLSILEAIEQDGELTVSEVQKRLYMEQSTASHHLNLMKKASILNCHKEGRNIFYGIDENYLKNFYQDFLKKLHEKQIEKIQKKIQQN
jgi:ArsR family transcriptional regulator